MTIGQQAELGIPEAAAGDHDVGPGVPGDDLTWSPGSVGELDSCCLVPWGVGAHRFPLGGAHVIPLGLARE